MIKRRSNFPERRKNFLERRLDFNERAFAYGGMARCGFLFNIKLEFMGEVMYPLNGIFVCVFCISEADEKIVQVNNNSSQWYDIGENFDVKSS